MASYFTSGVVFSRAERRVQIQLTSEITGPYSTTSVISGLFYTSYSPVVSLNFSTNPTSGGSL